MYNLLRTYRRKTELSIDNISFLLGLPDSSNVSRYERGKRRPTLKVIFAYHILFKAPIDKLFENEMQATQRKIALNISPLIESLLKQKQTGKIRERIVFLQLIKELIINENICEEMEQ